MSMYLCLFFLYSVASKDLGSQSTSTQPLKKKNPGQNVKKTIKKKKKVPKKKMLNDEDFEIDPRVGSKIKHNIKSGAKTKDKNKSSIDLKGKSMEQRSGPHVHIEGEWNLPSVVKIVNNVHGHVKVKKSN